MKISLRFRKLEKVGTFVGMTENIVFEKQRFQQKSAPVLL